MQRRSRTCRVGQVRTPLASAGSNLTARPRSGFVGTEVIVRFYLLAKTFRAPPPPPPGDWQAAGAADGGPGRFLLFTPTLTVGDLSGPEGSRHPVGICKL